MTPATTSKPIRRKKSSFLDRFGGRFLYISIAAHVLFGMIAVYFVVQRFESKRVLTFRSGNPAGNPGARMVEHKVQVSKIKKTMSAPAPSKRITTSAASARVALPALDMPMTPNESTPGRMEGSGGMGLGLGSAAMGAGGPSGAAGGGGAMPFFGLRIQAKRIAFLLDFSGSMDGPFRKEMEKELEHALQSLPRGTQVLIIPWAGPAWLSSQQASEIKGKWKMLNNEYDNFTHAGEKLDPPQWTMLDPDKALVLMREVRKQQPLPGGTDWRSPFLYVMEANPIPDIICFLTDGQIPKDHIHRAMSAIDTVFKNSLHPPVVNCFYIRNKAFGPEPLKALAAKYNGKFAEVGK